MVRVLNFCCFAITALACLALYRVSEDTRVTQIHLGVVTRQIADEKEAMKVLEAKWERVAEPSRIQQLASAQLGIDDAPTVSLASLEALPRRGDNRDMMQARLDSLSRSDPRLHDAAMHAGE
jgi:hypothetical protein